MEFGKTLRAAREAKNYTVSQLAETTHITPQIVEGLETENFKRIAAPIYGRGFVKLYCEAVGLDVKAMQQAFMAAYNGETPAPETIEETPPVPEAPIPPSEPKSAEPPPPVAQANEPEPPPPKRDLFEANRYAPPESSYRTLRRPQIPWRPLVVLVALIALVAFAFFSIKFVWTQLSAPAAEAKTTGASAKPAPAATPADKPVKTAKPVPPAAKREPKSVKSLYID